MPDTWPRIQRFGSGLGQDASTWHCGTPLRSCATVDAPCRITATVANASADRMPSALLGHKGRRQDRRQAGNCPGRPRRGVQPCRPRERNKMRKPVLRAALAASFLWLAAAQWAGAAPDAITVDGGRYYGPLVEGKLHGRGRIEWDHGTVHDGELAEESGRA